ncbi:magnetosome biogenesis transporter MamZ [Magnetofaba australis]|uniref:Protein-methionine-sulfoxide reductase heme-binding subunit MsrQ n=1 Tax=Magnetofaba australis IT-1 TaxID=1434232 RepID=W0LP28_9PROT|nr:magnetosome biogenesis transporter MamZ [Magnetofaba australis]AHG23905.1 ferric reductase domain-containing protein [Magnetofaba australis IT-1]OSM08652.1 putative ferric reductase domain-containing protein [Magnetofaba australis IT-1]
MPHCLHREPPWNEIYLLSALAALAIAIIVGLQPLFLDDVLKIPFEKSGTINANLTVVAEIVSLFVIAYLGATRHTLGRKWFVMGGFALLTIGALLAPFSLQIGGALGLGGLSVFYLARILSSLGANAAQSQLATLMGDAASHERRAGAIINIMLMMALGGGVIYAIILQIPHDIGGVLTVMLIPVGVGLAGAWLAWRRLREITSGHEELDRPMDRVWELVSGDPRMQLCFAASFYARADLIVISLFLSLWTINFADVVDQGRDYAVAHAALAVGFLGLVVILSMPLWRRFMQQRSRISAIGASVSLAGAGFIAMGFVVNPFDWMMVIPLLLIGVGQGGCLTAPKVLAAELAPPDILGAVQGIFYLVGGMGLVLLVQSGGYYFDAVGPRSPFILMGTGNLLIMLYAVYLMRTGMDENSEHTLPKKRRQLNLKPLIFLFSLLPLAWLVGRVLLSGYAPGSSLGQMPVGFINRYLGDWAFNFLLISLSLRPIYEITGVKTLAQYGRMVGLYAFFYALLHVLTYVWLEWVFKWGEMVDDIVKREFILLGVAAFVLLCALAATSFKQVVRKMGGKRWKQLHKLNYILTALVALHFIFAATHENGEPYVYALLVALLLGYRGRQYWKKRHDGASGPRPGRKRSAPHQPAKQDALVDDLA